MREETLGRLEVLGVDELDGKVDAVFVEQHVLMSAADAQLAHVLPRYPCKV